MAAQVLTGTGNVSYTNSTGQNVRLVINYLKVGAISGGTANITFGDCKTIVINQNSTYGKSLAYYKQTGGTVSVTSEKSCPIENQSGGEPLPLEIALANGDTFSIQATNATNISYNIIIIPEAG